MVWCGGLVYIGMVVWYDLVWFVMVWYDSIFWEFNFDCPDN